MSTKNSPYRALAVAVVANCVLGLKTGPDKPMMWCPRSLSKEGRRARWAAQRADDIAFFNQPHPMAAVWCETAGYDLDAVRSQLVRRKLLPPRPASNA